VTVINLLPVKQIVNSPLWTTDSVYRTVNFPKEYTNFIGEVKKIVPDGQNVISFPQNIASYAIITEENGRNAYIGTSPLRFFAGVNDLTGGMSYTSEITERIRQDIDDRKYHDLLSLLQELNTGYLIQVKNIPEEVLESYLFDKNYLISQDRNLIDSISEKQIYKSLNGNYVLFKLKNSPSLFTSNGKIEYHKISPVEYKIFVSRLNKPTELTFHQTFHPGWELSAVKSIESKRLKAPFGNRWVIDSSLNDSGKIEIKLFFTPQTHFYLGLAASFILLPAAFLLINKQNVKDFIK
jgi:hypothetical protein